MSIVDGDPADGRFVALYRRDGEPIGVLGWNMPKQVRRHRQDLVEVFQRQLVSNSGGMS